VGHWHPRAPIAHGGVPDFMPLPEELPLLVLGALEPLLELLAVELPELDGGV